MDNLRREAATDDVCSDPAEGAGWNVVRDASGKLVAEPVGWNVEKELASLDFNILEKCVEGRYGCGMAYSMQTDRSNTPCGSGSCVNKRV